jgi:hypothetical protein
MCGRILNGALSCPDCGTPTPDADGHESTLPVPAGTFAVGPGPLPPAVAPVADDPSGTPDVPEAAPGPSSRRPGGKTLIALAAVAALGAGLTTVALNTADGSRAATPEPHTATRSPQPEHAASVERRPTKSATPRTGGSDPEPAPTVTRRAAPSPTPTPTPEPHTPAPKPSPTWPRFSFPPFPTPSHCAHAHAHSHWC